MRRAISNHNFGQNNPNATTLRSGRAERLRQARPQLGLHDRSPARAHARASRVTGGYYHNTGGYFRYAFGSPFSSKERVTDNLARRARRTTTSSASRRRPIRSCRAAAAIRCAASYNVEAGQVRPESRTSSKSREQFGEFESTQRLLQRHARRPAAAQHPPRRRLRHRAFRARPLLRRRQPAGAAELPRRHPVQRRRRSSSCTASSRCRPTSSASFAFQNLSGSDLDCQLHRSRRPRSTGSARIGRCPAVRRRSRTSRSSRRRRCSKTASRGSTSGSARSFQIQQGPAPAQPGCLQRAELQRDPCGTTSRIARRRGVSPAADSRRANLSSSAGTISF